MGTHRTTSEPKKPHKIMYVVEGLSSGNPRVDRLHVLYKGPSPRSSYRGWTDSVRHTKWYSRFLVGATPESALKKATRNARARVPHYRARMKEALQRFEMYKRMYGAWDQSHRLLQNKTVW